MNRLLISLLIGISAAGISLAGPYDIEVRPSAAPAMRDGDLKLPADYKSWPVYLLDVQRPELKQIRDIYINTQGLKSSRPFAYGTTMVMELHSVKTGADGKPEPDAYGKLQKQGLSKVFVMGKGAGWGQEVPPEQRTGEWVFAAYDASGNSLGKDMSACRGCHVPLKDMDFVAKVPEFEAARANAR